MSKDPELYEWPQLWILPSGAVLNADEIIAVSAVTPNNGETRVFLRSSRENAPFVVDDPVDVAALRSHLLKVAVELNAPDVKE